MDGQTNEDRSSDKTVRTGWDQSHPTLIFSLILLMARNRQLGSS